VFSWKDVPTPGACCDVGAKYLLTLGKPKFIYYDIKYPFGTK
jgi:hypothetical protein